MVDPTKYAVFVSPLSEEDGGGFAARVPDLPGCMGDGETRAEALTDVENAILEWIDACEEMGRDIPEPGSFIKAAKTKRQEEVAMLRSLLEALRENEIAFDALEGRISLIEHDVKHLIEVFSEAESWERFEAITNWTERDQKEMFSSH